MILLQIPVFLSLYVLNVRCAYDTRNKTRSNDVNTTKHLTSKMNATPASASVEVQ